MGGHKADQKRYFFKFFEKLLRNSGVYHKPYYDDNYIDRMSYYYTNIFLLFYNMFSSSEEWFRYLPARCFCPNSFTKTEIIYTNRVCWVNNMYFVPWNKPIPQDWDIRQNEMGIRYYQWVPVICFLMALCFYFPRIVWKHCTNSSGLKLKRLMAISKNIQSDKDEETRQMNIRVLTELIDLYCSKVSPHRAGVFPGIRERFGSMCNIGFGRHYGNFFPALQIFVRFLYFINAVGQLLFLNAFVGNEFTAYGYEVISRFLNGEENYIGTSRFPFVTLCDIEIRRMFTFYRYTLQCVIPINIYNEKFFLLMWFWLVVVMVSSFLNLVFTIINFILPYSRKSFIKKYLAMNNLYHKETQDRLTKTMIGRFVEHHLRQDGIFILKLLSKTSNTVVVTHVVSGLWKKFQENEIQKNGGSTPNTYMKEVSIHLPINDHVMNQYVCSSSDSLSYYSEIDHVVRFPKETPV